MAGKRKDSKGRVLRNGEIQRKDGRYQYKYTCCGKTNFVYATDLAELREKEAKIQRDLADGINSVIADKMTLNNCVYKYLESKKRLRETTLTNYKYLYDKFVSPSLGETKVCKIKFSDIRNLYNNLLENEIQIGTLGIINNVLSPALEVLVRDDIIRSNPTKGIMSEIRNLHDTSKEKRVSMTPEEQSTFMSFAKESDVYERYIPLFTVLLGSGMRIGECLGLCWSDIDFKNGCINVNKTLTYKKSAKSEKIEFHIHETKTEAGKRQIPMLTEVKKALLSEYENRLARGICNSKIDGYSDFVFVNSRNNVFKPASINRTMDSIISSYNKWESKKAKEEKREAFQIRHFSAHNLRHTFLTNYCQHETNLKTIQSIAGHSNISVTMDVYAEATAKAKKESFDKLEGKFKIG